MMYVFKSISGLCISIPLVYSLNMHGFMGWAFCFGVGALVSFIPNQS